MHSIDLLPVHTSPSDETPTSYEDSVSSEGVPTPLEVPQSHSNFLGHSADAPLSINIPSKRTQPLVGTPFITDSTALFEYPFPPVSSRPPLSSASSSSSIASIPGPPSPTTLDKHSTHVFTLLSSRVGPPGHRRTSSHGGLSPIPIPPRLRKLSGGHISEESTPTQQEISTFHLRLSPRPDNQSDNTQRRAETLPSRGTTAARPNYSQLRTHSSPRIINQNELGPALSSTPRACMDIPITNRRRSMPAVLADSDDDHVDHVLACSDAEGTIRLRF